MCAKFRAKPTAFGISGRPHLEFNFHKELQNREPNWSPVISYKFLVLRRSCAPGFGRNRRLLAISGRQHLEFKFLKELVCLE